MESLPPYITGLFAVLLMTSFVKMLTTLSILRHGLGLQGSAFGLVIIGFALALSLLVMSPHLERTGGMEGILSGRAVGDLERNFRPFLSKNVDPEIEARFVRLEQRIAEKKSEGDAAQQAAAKEQKEPTTFGVLVAAFMVSELKEAFLIGMVILLPFILIDLIVANALMLLGATQISNVIIALPLKILLFVVVDGWTLISEKIVLSYV